MTVNRPPPGAERPPSSVSAGEALGRLHGVMPVESHRGGTSRTRTRGVSRAWAGLVRDWRAARYRRALALSEHALARSRDTMPARTR